MRFYFIDYENVQTPGLNGVSSLREEDSVLIFYSEKANTMTFGLHRRLNESPAQIQYHLAETGTPNALDFQLCSCLGYTIHEHINESASYFIVSKDRAYRILSSYWRRRNVDVNLVETIASGESIPDIEQGEQKKAFNPESFPTGQKQSPDNLEQELKKLLPDKKQEISAIAAIIRKYDSKKEIHAEFMRTFRPGPNHNMEMAGIYKLIKPLLTDKK